MKHGPAWIIFEESYQTPQRLVSILSPRKTVRDVAAYVEQLYIDRSSSLSERLKYKKSRKSAAYKPMIEGSVVHCGHEPHLVAIYAYQTNIKNNTLEFTYRIIIKRAEHSKGVVFEERSQSIEVL
ncbi:hypothetical protein ACQE3E_13555 [Methylomonas sp. MED-D]|uniref:hypothetical protein n=1 Tax=unclassified Methylomonas TaxID=2608980 RepID=UPI0028A3E393|nr:hypothetical protein [Methylomonas sp. MV1]MDT4331554.1 hypothetical protein [Methylomonas sp. MV1]